MQGSQPDAIFIVSILPHADSDSGHLDDVQKHKTVCRRLNSAECTLMFFFLRDRCMEFIIIIIAIIIFDFFLDLDLDLYSDVKHGLTNLPRSLEI